MGIALHSFVPVGHGASAVERGLGNSSRVDHLPCKQYIPNSIAGTCSESRSLVREMGKTSAQETEELLPVMAMTVWRRLLDSSEAAASSERIALKKKMGTAARKSIGVNHSDIDIVT